MSRNVNTSFKIIPKTKKLKSLELVEVYDPVSHPPVPRQRVPASTARHLTRAGPERLPPRQ